MRLLSRRNRERILQKGNEFAITTTKKPPPHHLPLFLFLGGNLLFLAFLFLIDEEVTSCSSRNEGKGRPSLPGILEGLPPSPHPRPLEIGAKKKVKKKGAGCLKLIRSWRKKEKENFLNRNASTKLPFHIDRRGMNFVN